MICDYAIFRSCSWNCASLTTCILNSRCISIVILKLNWKINSTFHFNRCKCTIIIVMKRKKSNKIIKCRVKKKRRQNRSIITDPNKKTYSMEWNKVQQQQQKSQITVIKYRIDNGKEINVHIIPTINLQRKIQTF